MFKRVAKRGFTLVELMIVVAIIGILAALAIYGVRQYMANAKTAEATQMLGRLGKDAQSKFNEERADVQDVDLTNVAVMSSRLCATAGTTVPVDDASISGQKYQSTPDEWKAGADDNTGWRCVGFSIDSPQYYRYGYESDTAAGAASAVGDTFTVTARGNLDNDAEYSTFTYGGRVQESADGNVVVTLHTEIDSENEYE